MLKSRLYEHARAMGIIGPEDMVGAVEERNAVVELEPYRMKKGARA
jgi:hypothetical protein